MVKDRDIVHPASDLRRGESGNGCIEAYHMRTCPLLPNWHTEDADKRTHALKTPDSPTQNRPNWDTQRNKYRGGEKKKKSFQFSHVLCHYVERWPLNSFAFKIKHDIKSLVLLDWNRNVCVVLRGPERKSSDLMWQREHQLRSLVAAGSRKERSRSFYSCDTLRRETLRPAFKS